MDYNGKYEPRCNFLQFFVSYYMHMQFNMELILIAAYKFISLIENSKSVPKNFKLLQYNLSLVYYKQKII
jgi:hypothetical protein